MSPSRGGHQNWRGMVSQKKEYYRSERGSSKGPSGPKNCAKKGRGRKPTSQTPEVTDQERGRKRQRGGEEFTRGRSSRLTEAVALKKFFAQKECGRVSVGKGY